MDYRLPKGLPLSAMANIPANQVTSVVRALAPYETPEAAAHAGASLGLIISRGMPWGYKNKLLEALDIAPNTLRNWTTGRVAITPQAMVRVVNQIAKDLPPHPELSTEEVANTLFGLAYEGREVDAAIWILDSFSTHFPWNELTAAA